MHFLFAVISLWLLTGFGPAAAQTTIHRCVGANGGPVFTDQPCSALGATSPVRSVTATASLASPAPVTLCAADTRQLKQVVIEAFADHDANRLAGVMLWGGYEAPAAIADIRALQQAMREPWLGLRTEPAADVDPAAAGTSATPPAEDAQAPTALVVETRAVDGNGGTHTLRFDVVRRAGCLWLLSGDGAGR